jgi:hypothetical protein
MKSVVKEKGIVYFIFLDEKNNGSEIKGQTLIIDLAGSNWNLSKIDENIMKQFDTQYLRSNETDVGIEDVETTMRFQAVSTGETLLKFQAPEKKPIKSYSIRVVVK